MSQVILEVPTATDPGLENDHSTLASTPWSTDRWLIDSEEFGNTAPPSTREIVDEPVGEVNQEMKLPPLKSLFIVVTSNALFQLSLFVTVPSANTYAGYLGGSATFAGLTIGIPPLVSGIALFFITKYDKGGYAGPFAFAYVALILGNVLHALAFLADYLYLILIGRIVVGFGFTSFMFIRRYCSDPRIVGVQKRTMLASWLVLGQGFGFTIGPFIGGLLYKIGFPNKVFNGYTSPGWLMVGVWTAFLVASRIMFEDPFPPTRSHPLQAIVAPRVDDNAVPYAGDPDILPNSETFASAPPPVSADPISEGFHGLNRGQWGVIICMCYYAMTCFFILGSWEANIPVFLGATLGYSPYQAGNFIALGGIATFPFLLLNIRFARRIQDRITLGVGSSLGFVGIIIMLFVLLLDKVNFGSVYACWFLVALGFNLATTCTLSLLSKQLPASWNGRISMAIQYSNYTGRVTGAVLGGAGVKIGMRNYIAIQIVVVGVGGLMYLTLWRELKAKTG